MRARSQADGAPLPTSLHSSVYRELIDFLTQARQKAGLTQQAIADRLGRPQSYVAKVEGFERRLDVVEFLEFAKAVDANPLPALKKSWTELTANSG